MKRLALTLVIVFAVLLVITYLWARDAIPALIQSH
jgi:hypothetical protein